MATRYISPTGSDSLGDGTAITEVTGNAAWAALTIEAFCYYNNTP